MAKDVIIACDFASKRQTLDFLDAFALGRKPFVKIGMELFYAEGPDIVRELKRRGHPVFLDLKLHDIPNTVRKSMRVLSGLDIDMCNVHAAGTVEMMMAGATAVQVGAENLRNPQACPEIIAALPALMDNLGINRLQDIIGIV